MKTESVETTVFKHNTLWYCEWSNIVCSCLSSKNVLRLKGCIKYVYCSFRNFPGIFGNQQQHYLEVIKRMLVQCMQDQENPTVIWNLFHFDWRHALFGFAGNACVILKFSTFEMKIDCPNPMVAKPGWSLISEDLVDLQACHVFLTAPRFCVCERERCVHSGAIVGHCVRKLSQMLTCWPWL